MEGMLDRKVGIQSYGSQQKKLLLQWDGSIHKVLVYGRDKRKTVVSVVYQKMYGLRQAGEKVKGLFLALKGILQTAVFRQEEQICLKMVCDILE